jgi:hypothetical protein
MLAVLVCLGERLPRSWLWLAGAWFGWNVLEEFTVIEPLHFLYVPLAFVPLIILGLAVAAVDPAAAERRKKRAEQDARVEVWMEPGRGTGAVAGRDLPAAEVIAADKRLTAAARWLKASGAEGNMDWLRSRAYLAFMNGYGLDGLLAGLLASQARAQDSAPTEPSSPTADDSAVEASAGDGHAQGPGCPDDAAQVPAGLATPAVPPSLAALAGTVNLTMPALTWLGLSEVPAGSRRVRRPGRGDVPRSDRRARRQPRHPLVRHPRHPGREADRSRLRPRRTRPAGQRQPSGLAGHGEDHPD